MLICPGGAYYMTSDREAEPIARYFMMLGYHAFVLRYTVAEHGPVGGEYVPLLDASRAMAYIRSRAAEWNMYTDKIGVIGFSAGGHLAASLGTMWQDEYVNRTLSLEYGANRPNAMILAYPVISGGTFAHRGSFCNLLGEADNDPERIKFWSLENHVTPLCPPSFVWHTASDDCVPVVNSLCFCTALSENNIPFELHVFPEGDHGLSTALREVRPVGEPLISRWLELCAVWLKGIFGV
ncbi:Acetylxylan esterase [bioreactor metagenome]|uniref:Acetylxylan esterase n=1 Tax=bioreactor metagenome TaxID=1076179 RepID=A0A645G6A7_9ZZZZ